MVWGMRCSPLLGFSIRRLWWSLHGAEKPSMPSAPHTFLLLQTRTGMPKVTNKCGHCKSKLDFGREFICCSDCSDPTIMDKNSKLGFCKSGADLTMQLKPQETFHWVVGPWMTCSSPCDGGIRYRDVACYGSLDDNTIKHYPVDDATCSADEVPARQEACNQQSCSDPEMTESMNLKSSGVPVWLIAFVAVLGLSAIGGIAFISYTYYMRRTSGPSGFVYVMMEAYS
ncbi:hypothetical protein BS78_03G192100 [Paspalum vaginatum]|nr:hypothetical protein BS78_03G192100 [Paspalum vaginatum]KAJ1284271.1 hypothetical protein BS78_03G192100 [Paspalum vaginatum]